MKRRRPPSGRIAVLLLFAFTEGTIAREVEEYNLSTNPTPAASPPNNFVDDVELADLSWSTVRNRFAITTVSSPFYTHEEKFRAVGICYRCVLSLI